MEVDTEIERQVKLMAKGFVTLESFSVEVDGEEGLASVRLIFRTKAIKALEQAIQSLQAAKGALEAEEDFQA